MFTCRKCGGRFGVTVRCNQFERGGITLKVRAPDPNSYQVVNSLMISAVNHGVGSRNPQNRDWERIVETAKHPNGERIYRYAFKVTDAHHTASCPIGQFRRNSEFRIQSNERLLVGRG